MIVTWVLHRGKLNVCDLGSPQRDPQCLCLGFPAEGTPISVARALRRGNINRPEFSAEGISISVT